MFPGLTNLKSTNPYQNTTGIGNDNKAVGGLATQNLGGNSLTQYMRSMQNYMGTQGAATFGEGRDITNTGIQGFGPAGDAADEALGTTRKALDTLSPAEDYWTKLLSGDQKTMNQAISPTATQAGTNYANAISNVNMNGARGGYSSTLAAGMPFAQAREVNEQLYKLQPTAATNLNTIAGTKNTIAGTQGNIAAVKGQLATWLSSIGIDVSKLGAGFLDMASQSLMAGRGQDVGEHGQAMSLAGQLAGDATGTGNQIIRGSQPMGSGCWIAEAIYGIDDPRTHLVRAWLNGPFRAKLYGRMVMSLYLKIGRTVAAMVRMSSALRCLLKPLFDKALTRALAERKL